MFLVKLNGKYELFDEKGNQQDKSWTDRPDTGDLRAKHGSIKYRDVDTHGEDEVPFDV